MNTFVNPFQPILDAIDSAGGIPGVALTLGSLLSCVAWMLMSCVVVLFTVASIFQGIAGVKEFGRSGFWSVAWVIVRTSLLGFGGWILTSAGSLLLGVVVYALGWVIQALITVDGSDGPLLPVLYVLVLALCVLNGFFTPKRRRRERGVSRVGELQ